MGRLLGRTGLFSAGMVSSTVVSSCGFGPSRRPARGSRPRSVVTASAAQFRDHGPCQRKSGGSSGPIAGFSGRPHLVLLLLLLASLSVLGDKRPLFQEPKGARLRFLKGKRLPHICKDPASITENPKLEFAELARYPRKVLRQADPELMDASLLVDAVHENVGNDVILTRENFLNAWSRKLPLNIYEWEQGSLPPNLAVAFGGRARFNSCALVGSSGHLRRTMYGSIIDKFDAVARANQSPTKGYEARAGSKTTIRFMNEAVGRQYRDATRRTAGIAAGICKTTGSLTNKGQYVDGLGGITRISLQPYPGRRLTADEGPPQNFTGRVKRVKNVNRVSRLCPIGMDKMMQEGRITKNHVRHGKWDFPMEQGVMMAQVSEQKSVPKSFMELQHNIRLLRQDVKLFMIPNTMTHMTFHVMDNWADRMVCKKLIKNKGGARPTTGFQMAMVMLRLCNRVVLYGFGPSAKGQRDSAYHFFQGHGAKTWQTSSDKVHNFRAEFLFFKSLQSKGLITICNDASSADCGLSDVEMGEAMAAEQVAAGEAADGTSPAASHEHPAESGIPTSRRNSRTRRGWLGVGRRASIVARGQPDSAAELGGQALGKPKGVPVQVSLGSFLKEKAAAAAASFNSHIEADLVAANELDFEDEQLQGEEGAGGEKSVQRAHNEEDNEVDF